VDENTWAAGGWPSGTNNQGELTAVLDLLWQTAHLAGEELHVLCDSKYAMQTIRDWMPGWKANGWIKKSDKKRPENLEIVKALDEAMAGRRVTFEWVKGHAGNALNEAADTRARAAATAYQEGKPPETGPGYPGAARTQTLPDKPEDLQGSLFE
jgi:ribonuclease HI